VVFKGGRNVASAKEFVRFLVAEGWLAHYLEFSAERFLPAMSKLLDQPFWLDPSDRHQMVAVMQAESRPLAHDYTAASGDLGHDQVFQERVWAKAIHRIATEGVSPEQAVDEAIARIKQILSGSRRPPLTSRDRPAPSPAGGNATRTSLRAERMGTDRHHSRPG
jgi:multiple sugar transport system substrate-binding protein